MPHIDKERNMKTVYIINGRPRAGKDTFVSLFGKNIATENYSSVDPVKEIAKQVGWDGRKTEADRKFLSDLKKLLTEYNDFPFEKTKEEIGRFIEGPAQALFIHIREPEEIQKTLNFCNREGIRARTVLVTNPRTDENPTSNTSDERVLLLKYDIIVKNSGTFEDLEHEARAVIRRDLFPGKEYDVYDDDGNLRMSTSDIFWAIKAIDEHGGYALNEAREKIY